jgi:HEAT repeat protein
LAAIWSLGYICDPRNDPEVVEALRGRVADTAVQPMEDLRVRAHAGASLGRMGASSSIDFLREWSDRESVQSLIGRYCAWGVLQLDGTPLPELQPRRQAVSGWSLKPVR